jgi:hypothetical protein
MIIAAAIVACCSAVLSILNAAWMLVLVRRERPEKPSAPTLALMPPKEISLADRQRAAKLAVTAAEQRYPMKSAGQDKARYARQFVMDTLGLSGVEADVLVEAAVVEMKTGGHK